MTKALEIEFKNMLTKKEFDFLYEKYKNSFLAEKTQTNFYFDTYDMDFKKNKTTVRIRKINNNYYFQIKQKVDDSKSDEFEEILSEDSFFEMMQNGFTYDSKKVHLITSLITNRSEFKFRDNLVCLDFNEFTNGTVDYELEMESLSKEVGYNDFIDFININNIQKTEARGKRYRAFKVCGID